MSKSTVQRQVEKELANQRKSKGLWKGFWGAVAVVATLIAIYQFIWPRITVTPQAPLVASDPFSAMFSVANNAWLSLYDVDFSCAPRAIIFESTVSHTPIAITSSGLRDEDSKGGFTSPSLQKKDRLEPDHPHTIACPFPEEWKNMLKNSSNVLRSANILIVTTYHPVKLLPIQLNNQHRFALIQDEHGNYRWVERSLKDTPL
jgi:hypothetical protein